MKKPDDVSILRPDEPADPERAGVSKETFRGGRGQGGFRVPPATVYRFGRTQIGHVQIRHIHNTGVADLTFPRKIHYELISDGGRAARAGGLRRGALEQEDHARRVRARVGSSIGWIVGEGREAAKEILGVPPERTVRTTISYKEDSMRQMKLVSFVILCTLLLVSTIGFAQESNGNFGYGVTTPGRLWATIDAVVGLMSAILAGLSLFRSSGRFGTGTGRRGAIVAAVVGLIVISYAVLHLTIFTGGFGTGSGRAGAIVAIVMGLTSMVLAGITLTRSRRTG